MMGYGYSMMGGGLGLLIPLILLGLVIYAFVKFSQGGFVSQTHHSHGSRALDILKERYAKGEISEEEYIQKKELLKE